MAEFDYYPRYGAENYFYSFPIEKSFNAVYSTEWMQKYWVHSISISLAYVILIYLGKKFMESRKPFELNSALFWWNSGLAIFSTMGMIRMAPEVFWAVNSNSFVYSVCTASYAQGVTGYWTENFAMSKVFELIDTAFIILRKKPLIFLHWYHHVTVLVYTCHAYKDHTASGRWFIFINYTVHSLMYTYYALRSLRIRVPKSVAMLITLLQIAQMIGGVSIGVFIYFLKSNNGKCQQTWTNLYFSFTIYFTYFLLFCNFFYHSYLKRNNRYKTESDFLKASDLGSKKNLLEILNSNNNMRKSEKNLNRILLKEIINDENDNYFFDKNVMVDNDNEFINKHVSETHRRSGVITPRRSSPPITRSRRVVRVD